jgi:Flp pilus assembly protein protease CpaA
MDANLFLIIIGFIWVIMAIIQDFKRREVANWLNFSLIIFALSYRLFYSILSNSYSFFIQGVIGFLIFLVLGNLFYYSRIFAGGDAKLFIALGSIIPFSLLFKENVPVFIVFIISFLIFGGIYGVLYSFFILFRNRKQFSKLFKSEFKKRKSLFLIAIIFSIISFILVYQNKTLILFPLVFLLFPLMYIYAKSLEECMCVEVNVNKLTEGDWLYQNVTVKGKTIKASWDGLTPRDIELLKKYKKKVKLKQGIPFTPAFLFALIFLVILWYSSWEMVKFWF